MEYGITEWSVIFITTAFGILIIIFGLQTIIKKRTAWSLLISMIFGLLAGIISIINELFFKNIQIIWYFFQSLHLNLYGFHFFFFFIFFERLVSKNLNSLRLSLMTSLLLIQTIGLWLVYYYRLYSMSTDIAWVLADFGYWTPALFVYLGLGVPIYFKMYLYTKEIKPLALMVALIFVSIGFFISFLNDLYFIFSVFNISINKPEIISTLEDISNIFPSIGIIIFVIIYITNIDYLYRLPYDVHLLMVLERGGGTPLYTVKLKTRNKIEIEDVLLSGLFSAINTIFQQVLQSKKIINVISSKEMSILIKGGKSIVTLVITSKNTYFLDKALARFVKIFEKEFEKELKEGERDLTIYERAHEIISIAFPFFILEKNNQS